MKKTLTDEDKKLFKKMYETHTIKDIAEYFNISDSNVRTIAKHYNLKKKYGGKNKNINIIDILGFDEYTYG